MGEDVKPNLARWFGTTQREWAFLTTEGRRNARRERSRQRWTNGGYFSGGPMRRVGIDALHNHSRRRDRHGRQPTAGHQGNCPIRKPARHSATAIGIRPEYSMTGMAARKSARITRPSVGAVASTFPPFPFLTVFRV